MGVRCAPSQLTHITSPAGVFFVGQLSAPTSPPTPPLVCPPTSKPDNPDKPDPSKPAVEERGSDLGDG